MAINFAILKATRKLENYLSREHYGLTRMEENSKVPYSLFETKVGHYNELVDTLNELFGNLTESEGELFQRFLLEDEEIPEIDEFGEIEDEEVVGGDWEENPKPTVYTHKNDKPISAKYEDGVPQWKAEGYDSYDEWLVDRESENVEISDDLALGVDTNLSKHRVEEALDDYEENSQHKIEDYDPEEDKPVDVLDNGFKYLNHTADNKQIDNDPTQIAEVTTAVESDKEGSRKSTEIEIDKHIYRPDSNIVDNLIDDEIEKLKVNKE